MALIGSAAIVMWNDTQDPAATAIWHSRQHLAERLSCPGFLRGRRMICPEQDRCEHFMLYELATLEIADSQPYLDRLNNPTEWSQSIMKTVIEHSRTTCNLRRREGLGVTPMAVIGRVMPSAEASKVDVVIDRFLTDALEHPGVTGISWIEKVGSVPSGMTQEQALRGKRDGTVQSAFLVEGYDRDCLRRLAQTDAFGAFSQDDVGLKLFQLDHVVTAQDV